MSRSEPTRPRARPGFWAFFALVAMLCGPGCLTPYLARAPQAKPQPKPWGKGPDLSGRLIVDSPRNDTDPDLQSPGTSIETWVVHTRACEQILGTNPWTGLTVARLDEHGGPLHGAEPEELLQQMAGRPVVILIHGNGYGYRDAIKEGIEVRAKLEAKGGFAPDSLFVIFDWPSERSLKDIIVDLNEKARRSRVAGYHLARILQASPPESRICLMGQSDGGRIVLTTTHLLSGAELPRFLREPSCQLSSGRRDLRIRCIALDAAAAHDWLDPGHRLQQTLPTCEALLNLPNRRDYALAVYTFGRYTGNGGAIGRVGLTWLDRHRLGPLADKVEEIDHFKLSGMAHTLFTQALDFPVVSDRIAAYTSWGDIEAGRLGEGRLRKVRQAPANVPQAAAMSLPPE
ncbi:alpha/beta hydrolase [Tundrisphaera sp. TA3]|uniref:alpha/beta hydrolase n=1 Tax=Tundrisphaera sp. TA3 TaxID=3435775 RepID=UPI003EBA63D3